MFGVVDGDDADEADVEKQKLPNHVESVVTCHNLVQALLLLLSMFARVTVRAWDAEMLVTSALCGHTELYQQHQRVPDPTRGLPIPDP